jgi:hypothetical protein
VQEVENGITRRDADSLQHAGDQGVAGQMHQQVRRQNRLPAEETDASEDGGHSGRVLADRVARDFVGHGRTQSDRFQKDRPVPQGVGQRQIAGLVHDGVNRREKGQVQHDISRAKDEDG